LLVLLTESEHWILLPISSDEALFSHDFFLSQRQEGKKTETELDWMMFHSLEKWGLCYHAMLEVSDHLYKRKK